MYTVTCDLCNFTSSWKGLKTARTIAAAHERATGHIGSVAVKKAA